jgi:hypothetical protein
VSRKHDLLLELIVTLSRLGMHDAADALRARRHALAVRSSASAALRSYDSQLNLASDSADELRRSHLAIINELRPLVAGPIPSDIDGATLNNGWELTRFIWLARSERNAAARLLRELDQASHLEGFDQIVMWLDDVPELAAASP